MTKAELVAQVALKTELTQEQTAKIVNLFKLRHRILYVSGELS